MVKTGFSIATRKVKNALKKAGTRTSIRKTLNTTGKVAGLYMKYGLVSAMYANPTTVIPMVAGSLALKYMSDRAATKTAQRVAEGKLGGKTGNMIMAGLDATDFASNVAAKDYFGAARNATKFIKHTEILGKKKTRDFNTINNNYLDPSLSILQEASSIKKLQ